MKGFTTILPLALAALTTAAPSPNRDIESAGFDDKGRDLFPRVGPLQPCRKVRSDLRTCQNNVNDLQAQVDSLQNQYDTCSTSLSDAQGQVDSLQGEYDTCSTALSDAQDQLSQCQAEIEEGTPADDYLRCPGLNGQQVTVGGVTYNQYCNQGIAQGTTVLRRVVLRYDACVEACSADSACQGVNYWPANDLPCLMFSQYNTNLGNRGNYVLISAVPTSQR